MRNGKKPEIGQYWEISNGNDSLNALIIEKDFYIVQLFDPTTRNDVYKLNDIKFDMLPEDVFRKLEEPRLIPAKKSSELYFLDILSTYIHFYHYCCVISISKYM